MAALEGVHLGARPDLWQAYPDARERVLAAARPASQLFQRFPEDSSRIERVVNHSGMAPASLAYLPLVARDSVWTVLVNARTAEVAGFVALDSF